MTSVGTWPPLPYDPPEKSPSALSSHVMMTIPPLKHQFEVSTDWRLFCSQVSPALIKSPPLSAAQGDPELVSPCISLQSLGTTYTKSGAPAASSTDFNPPVGYGTTPSVLRFALLHQ